MKRRSLFATLLLACGLACAQSPIKLRFSHSGAESDSQHLAALEFDIPAELSQRLDEASRPELIFPYIFFSPGMRGMLTGGVTVLREPPAYRGE